MTTTHSSPSVKGPLCNLRFASDIDLMGSSSGELQDLTNRLVERAIACGIVVSTEKSKIMTNSTNNIGADISMNGRDVRRGDLLQVHGSKAVQGRHLLSRSPLQDCLSNGSTGQTKQDLTVQHLHLHK